MTELCTAILQPASRDTRPVVSITFDFLSSDAVHAFIQSLLIAEEKATKKLENAGHQISQNKQ